MNNNSFVFVYCEVHVSCSGSSDAVYEDEGVIVHTIGTIFIPMKSEIAKRRLEYDLFESDVTKEMIREHTKRNFDVIHTHGELIKAAFIVKKVHDIKWIHTFHAIEKLRVKKLSKEEKVFGDLISWLESTANYCDGAIFVSEDLLKEGMRHYKLKSKKVIPNGVDTTMFEYTPITRKNVLFVGRFSKEKGIHLFPEIIPEVMKIDGATITLVCPYETPTIELEEIKKLIQAQKQKYPERITIIDQPQSRESIRDLYQECQVYIQPSKYESFGLCVVEAMSTGRPVVAFHVGGMPEVIGNAGYTVKNTAELINKIKHLINNPQECLETGKKARERAKLFDWDNIAKRVIEYYSEVKNE